MTRRLSDEADKRLAKNRRRREERMARIAQAQETVMPAKKTRANTTKRPVEVRRELPLIQAIATAIEETEGRRGRKLSYPALAALAVEVMEEMAEEALRE